jgi:hypothetical protein
LCFSKNLLDWAVKLTPREPKAADSKRLVCKIRAPSRGLFYRSGEPESRREMKVVYTLAVNNYFPELCELTLPNHEAYAKRIGARFEVITERKFGDWGPTYEKLQIHELGKNNDYSIHIDADMLISPEMWDVTERLDGTTVGTYSIYDPALYFRPDEYFMRDGRRIGVCSSFCAVPRACHDFWTPFDISREEAQAGTNSQHGIDDYCFSRNLARYGLKHQLFLSSESEIDRIKHLSVGGAPKDKEATLREAKEALQRWNT